MHSLDKLLSASISKWLKRNYNLTSDEKQLEYLSQAVRKVIRYYEAEMTVHDKCEKSPKKLFRVHDRWARTTTIPFAERWKHSAFVFAKFIDDHYYVLMLPKFWLRNRREKIWKK